MTFVGNGKVWDDKKKKVLCKFGVNGVLKTKDTYIINRLHEMGYTEADDSDMVAIEICNSVNVDWRERYETLKEKHTALQSAYVAIEKKLEDIESTMRIPVSVPDAEEATEQVQNDNYNIDGDLLPKDYESLNLMKLKSFLAKHGYDMKEMRSFSKEKVLILVNKLLTDKGLVN
jgi:hypothetical protein